MKVLFLDVDGVLNSQQYHLQSDREGTGRYTHLAPSCIERLRRIVEATGADIVLSSSWREMFAGMEPAEPDARHLLDALAEYGLSLMDHTPQREDRRREEIMAWLADHEQVERFVILDDWDYEWEELEPYWVRTSYSTGLTEEDADEAIHILK